MTLVFGALAAACWILAIAWAVGRGAEGMAWTLWSVGMVFVLAAAGSAQ